MADIESASAETATQDCAGNAEIETENSALHDIENQDNGLVNHIAGMLEGVKSTSSSEHCIFRVPTKVRKINAAAYTPRMVSIGPFHHGSERLQSMEAEKLCYFKKLIERKDVRLTDYVRLMKRQEQRIHRCYAEIYSNKLPLGGDDFAETYSNKLPLSGDDFLTMILVDAGFIIELLLSSHSLFNLTFAADKLPPLLGLALRFFHNVNRQYRLPNFELYEAGVKFKVDSSKCLLDIEFSEGVLEITYFIIDDKTIPYFRNLMALELCLYPHDSYIIDYIAFMDDLIKTPKVVDLLVQKGILVNRLGDSGAAATIFSNLCTEITMNFNHFYFSRLYKGLHAYYKEPWHMWKVTLKRDYFGNPWRKTNTSAAIMGASIANWLEEDALESKQLDSKYNANEVGNRNEKTEVPILAGEGPVDAVQDDLPMDKKDNHGDNKNGPAVATVKRKLHGKLCL
ncbi:hypothetical protein F0562_007308 [Nyssa sinensis]|uniref:Uncharacterized protein n=1 Tax=Nyssa sinensis TaxID=561372 RepID=A0A5J5A2X9_9ASTE|nr:hypothetical protein F0562_007308 [Nyssa sinensis]